MTDKDLAYPLQWPHAQGKPRTPDSKRERALFNSRAGRYGHRQLTLAEARDRLLEQFDKLTPHGKPWRIPLDDVTISSNVPTRKDGLPYSNAREPDDPGVAVYFFLDGEPRCMPCDKWDRVADNLAAIAKTFEADRGKARWGVVTVAESYKHAALPAPEDAGGTHWSDVLGTHAQSTNAEIRKAYQRLRSKHHPDTGEYGGDAAQFYRVQAAWAQAKRERNL